MERKIEYCPRCIKDRIVEYREYICGGKRWKTGTCVDCRTTVYDLYVGKDLD